MSDGTQTVGTGRVWMGARLTGAGAVLGRMGVALAMASTRATARVPPTTGHGVM